MANDQIKKADNGTYYFRANLGFDHSTGKRIQKYRSGSIRLRIYERFVGGMVEGRIPLPGREKGQRSQIGANGFI